MLNTYLGADKFAVGVKSYLKKHAFGNAKTTDLFNALMESSGKDVASMMHTWTKSVGYPMVTVTSEKFDESSRTLTLQVAQQRFLSSGGLEAADDLVLWYIPIEVITHLNPKSPIQVLLNTKTGTITLPFTEEAGSYYKLNFETTGFYRVCYPAKNLQRLGSIIQNEIGALSSQDKIGILADAFAFAKAGYLNTSSALELVNHFVNEEDYFVLDEVASCLKRVSNAWYMEPKVLAGINRLNLRIFARKVKVLGYDYSETEPFLVSLKRTLLISQSANSGDQRFFVGFM